MRSLSACRNRTALAAARILSLARICLNFSRLAGPSPSTLTSNSFSPVVVCDTVPMKRLVRAEATLSGFSVGRTSAVATILTLDGSGC